MAVYVGDKIAAGVVRYRPLFSDARAGDAELHAFAASIGIPRRQHRVPRRRAEGGSDQAGRMLVRAARRQGAGEETPIAGVGVMAIRVVMIEADGDSVRTAIDAALSAFGFGQRIGPAVDAGAAAASPGIAAPSPASAKSPKRIARRKLHRALAAGGGGGRTAMQAAGAGPVVEAIETNGVTIDPTPNGESISYGGRTTELTAKLATLALALARGMPLPVDRRHLCAELGLSGEWADQMLSQHAKKLGDAVGTIGLIVKTVRGVGIAMQPAE